MGRLDKKQTRHSRLMRLTISKANYIISLHLGDPALQEMPYERKGNRDDDY